MLLKEYLGKNRLITDGSMGTYYSRIVNRPEAISEFANLSAPDRIKQIHKDYIKAGAKILRTNTFAANRSVLAMETPEQIRLIKAACRIAKEAAQEAAKEAETAQEAKEAESARSADRRLKPVWIMGDIGPIPENAGTDESEILKEYLLMCDVFLDEKLDGIHFETFPSMHYIEKLLPYIKARNKDMFLLASFSVNKNGYTSAGVSAARLFQKAGENDDLDACGLNCGIGSGHMYPILNKINFPVNKYIYAAPNAGYPEQMQNRMVFMDNAGYFSENMKQIAGLGVHILGSCCGTTPEYTKKLTKNISSQAVPLPQKKSEAEPEMIRQAVKENAFDSLLKRGKKVIAVELDPPYDTDIDKIMECAHIVRAGGTDLITFADSPMGRSRVDSILMGIKIAQETGMNVMPHICCRDRNMISMRSTLLGAYIHGIRNLLVVTGDPVPGESRIKTTGVFDYNSVKLMEYIKEMNAEHFTDEPIHYGGALNYARGNIDKVAEHMKRKIEAGATYFLTQPIFSKEDAKRIQTLKSMVNTKILCGIMPLVSYRNACFIKNEISGIHVPDEIVARYRPDMLREEAEDVGACIAREIMEFLSPFADGYYFMLPFNRVSLMDKILLKK